MATIFIWPGRLLYVGPGVDTDAHAHYAHQVTVALARTVTFALADGRALHAGTIVIPAMCSHRQYGQGAPVASLYVDASFATMQALSPRRLVSGPAPAARVDCSVDEARAFESELRALADLATPASLSSARVRRIVEQLRNACPNVPRLTTLAREHGISASRLTHLLSSELGLPYRAYVLWLRVQAALDSLSADGSLTRAAHHAGFADAAHLSRTFRRMFGIAPSEALRGVRIVRLDDG